jgi:hypothetical protein
MVLSPPLSNLYLICKRLDGMFRSFFVFDHVLQAGGLRTLPQDGLCLELACVELFAGQVDRKGES